MQLTQTVLTAVVAAAIVIGAGYVLSRFTPHQAYAGTQEKNRSLSHYWRGRNTGGHRGGFCKNESHGSMREMAAHVENWLNLTSDQKPAWENLASAIAAGETAMRETCGRMDAAKDGSAPDNLAQAEVMLATSLDALRKIRPAFETLYARLDATQRKTVDDMFGHNGHRR